MNSDLTTVTLSQQFQIEINGNEFLLLKLVSVDLKKIDNPDFQLKEDLTLLSPFDSYYHRVMFDDKRRINLNRISRRNWNYLNYYRLCRAEDLDILQIFVGLETALQDFLCFKSDLKYKENPIQLCEFEPEMLEEDSFEVLEMEID